VLRKVLDAILFQVMWPEHRASRYFATADRDRIQYQALFRLCYRGFAGDAEEMIEILRGFPPL